MEALDRLTKSVRLNFGPCFHGFSDDSIDPPALAIQMLERLTRYQVLVVGAALAAVAICAIAGIVGAGIIFGGWYDVSARKPHSLLTSWVLHTTMTHSIRTRAHYETAPFSARQVREGFGLYEDHCAMCHGGPGVARPKWVMGLEPTPPYLLDAAQRWSPAELRFIIKHGVKMTAMPAWGLSRSEEDITSLVAFLERLPDVTPNEYRAMQSQRSSRSGTPLQPAR
jgi:Cytochrome c, mono- and diheme variants